MEWLGVALSVGAILLVFGVEWIKRPRIEIRTKDWHGRASTPWQFATVEVRNRPLPRILRAIFVRETASAATAMAEFRRAGARILPEIPCRWSTRPEPLRFETVDQQDIAVVAAKMGHQAPIVTRVVYDPTLVPGSTSVDLAAGRWDEVAVAVQHDNGDAYAFGAESYAYSPPPFSNPDWKLDRAEYEVTITVESSGVTARKSFKLDNLAADFSRFKLTER